jgi:riboflavin-specific deaminase-like protein
VKLGIDFVWKLILEAVRLNRTTEPPVNRVGLGIGAHGDLLSVPSDSPEAILVRDGAGTWYPTQATDDTERSLFDLYLPFCRSVAHCSMAVAHLGQSLDGRIATETGASCYVTGPDNITHLHRMRALADAIVVGTGTVRNDDPRLTTRRVPGTNPVRVIIDPGFRLAEHYNVFQDGAAATLLLCDPVRVPGSPARHGQAEVVGVPSDHGYLRPTAIVRALRERNLRRIFVEGGGITVSRFLQDRVLDGLQIAVAPLIIGSGLPSITLPVIADLTKAMRPHCRVIKMGADVLFDCKLEADSVSLSP